MTEILKNVPVAKCSIGRSRILQYLTTIGTLTQNYENIARYLWGKITELTVWHCNDKFIHQLKMLLHTLYFNQLGMQLQTKKKKKNIRGKNASCF